jgi:hypothetical protein
MLPSDFGHLHAWHKAADGFALGEPGTTFTPQLSRKEVLHMFKRFFRIGLLRGLCRSTLRPFVRLLSLLSRPLRHGLAYAWKNRRQIAAFIKASLEVLRLLCDVIKNIRNLLFCKKTAHFVQVAG